MQYYERVYPKFQDLISNVGGLCSFVIILAEIINFLVNHYIILFDMSNYMNEIKYNKQLLNIKIDTNNNNDFNKLYPPKKTNSSKTKLFIKETDLFNKDIKLFNPNENKKNSSLNNSSLNKNKLLVNNNNLYLNNESLGSNNRDSISYKYNNNLMKEKMDSQSNINLKDNVNKNSISNKINNEKINSVKLNFIDYLCYLISFKKCHSNIQLCIDFRIKMISEENLILSHLNIDKLFKKENSNNINIESEATQKLNLNNY